MEKDEYNTYRGKAYRFISIDGLINTIQQKSLRFSRSDMFNDPLDCAPLIAPYDWNKYVLAGTEFIENTKKKIFIDVLRPLYICCFSKEYKSKNSYLMWSHYGMSHTQACFELDFSKTNFLGSPSSVVYVKEMTKLREDLRDKSSSIQGLHMITSKMDVWRYEKEVRLIVDTRLARDRDIFVEIDQNERYKYVQFDPRLISKIIFGANTTASEMVKVFLLCSLAELKYEFYKMWIDPKTLKLREIKILNIT